MFLSSPVWSSFLRKYQRFFWPPLFVIVISGDLFWFQPNDVLFTASGSSLDFLLTVQMQKPHFKSTLDRNLDIAEPLKLGVHV